MEKTNLINSVYLSVNNYNKTYLNLLNKDIAGEIDRYLEEEDINLKLKLNKEIREKTNLLLSSPRREGISDHTNYYIIKHNGEWRDFEIEIWIAGEGVFFDYGTMSEEGIRSHISFDNLRQKILYKRLFYSIIENKNCWDNLPSKYLTFTYPEILYMIRNRNLKRQILRYIKKGIFEATFRKYAKKDIKAEFRLIMN